MRHSSINLKAKQEGAVLAISLLLLLVLTFVAVTAMEGNSLSFKMSANNIQKDEAFNNAESIRMSTADVVVEFLYEADWSAVTLPSGFTVIDGNIIQENAVGEDPFDSKTLVKDFTYSSNGITGDIYVLRSPTVANKSGAGQAQYKGYGGTGVAAGAPGGSFNYYEFRTKGTKAEASSWTASDYKYVQ